MDIWEQKSRNCRMPELYVATVFGANASFNKRNFKLFRSSQLQFPTHPTLLLVPQLLDAVSWFGG